MAKSETCSMQSLLNQLSGTWTTYILWFLHQDKTLRFGELRRKIEGISTKVLTERLRMLESMEIVYRHYEPTIPPQVTYGLTDRGNELTKALTPLYKLVLRWQSLE
jgi:DNA-binding HxlR family transcriptional regulator